MKEIANVCVTCASGDRVLVCLDHDCLHILQLLFPEMSNMCVLICWECRALLRRIKNFTLSVRRVQEILKTAESTLKTTSSLVISEIYHMDINLDGDADEIIAYDTNRQINNDSSDGEYTLASIKANTLKESTVDVKEKKVTIVNARKKKRKKKDFYRCKECGETFGSRGRYEYHAEKHKDRPQCDACGKTFVSKSTLWLHRQLHHADSPPHACDGCGARFFTASGLAAHGACGGHACAPCGKMFKTLSGLAKHTRARHRPAGFVRYKCSECPREFDTEEACRSHKEVVHMGLRRHRCGMCSKEYCTARALLVHVRAKHEGRVRARDQVCEMCGKMFTTRQILDAHRRTHAGKKANIGNG